jgi:hypothetical protein
MKKTFYQETRKPGIGILLPGFLTALFISAAPAATVVFQYQTPFGQATAPAISLTPGSVTVQSNTIILSGLTTFRWPTNGLAVDAWGNTNFWGWTNGSAGQPQLRLPLSGGSYTVNVSGFPTAQTLAVPVSTNVFYASDLSSNTIILAPATVNLISTNGGSGTNGQTYTAGTGITINANVISLYSAPTITAFANNQNSLEIGTTVASTLLTWTLGGGAITAQSLDNSIGAVPTALRSYTNAASYTTSRTYNLTVTDGVTTNTSATAVNFYSKEYWGASAQTAPSISDAQIIALGGAAFATSRATTQTISTSSTYLFFCYPASFGAATFVVNGFPDAGWTLLARNFVNASGATVSYNIYQHTLATAGSYTVQVQ